MNNENIKIYNNNCYEKIKDIPDKSIDLIIIDPPYDIPNNYTITDEKNLKNGKRQNGKNITRIDKARINKTVQIKDMSNGIDFEILKEFERISKKLNLYIFCNKTLLFKLINYYNDEKKYSREILVWCKTNPLPLINETFLPDIEYIFYVKEKGVKLYGDYKLRHKYFIQPANISDKKKYIHPTIKPQNILSNLILVSSKENDTILDCFMGSGSTAIACMRTQRKFIDIEIEKKYFEIAKDRVKDEIRNIKIFDYL